VAALVGLLDQDLVVDEADHLVADAPRQRRKVCKGAAGGRAEGPTATSGRNKNTPGNLSGCV
jgi:hypothetical protein